VCGPWPQVRPTALATPSPAGQVTAAPAEDCFAAFTRGLSAVLVCVQAGPAQRPGWAAGSFISQFLKGGVDRARSGRSLAVRTPPVDCGQR